MKYQLIWIVLAFTTLQQNAVAKTELCDQRAPLLESGSYHQIDDPMKIPDDELKLLRQFAKLLEGNWRGEEIVASCEGHFSNPKSISDKYLVQAEITTSSRGVVRMAAKKEPDHSVTKYQTLWLTPETEMLTNRQRWHTLEFADNNTLIYSHKYRAKNGQTVRTQTPLSRHTARLVHEINRLSFRGRQLIIDRKIYVNGTIIEQSGISLLKTAS